MIEFTPGNQSLTRKIDLDHFMNNQTIEVRVSALDEKLLDQLFETKDGIRAKTASIDGVEFMLSEIKRRPGMTAEDIIITIVINLATGITTGLLAAWIFDKLTGKGETPVEVGDDPEVKTTVQEIEEAIVIARKERS